MKVSTGFISALLAATALHGQLDHNPVFPELVWDREITLRDHQELVETDAGYLYGFGVVPSGEARGGFSFTGYDRQTGEIVWDVTRPRPEYNRLMLDAWDFHATDGELYVFYHGYDHFENQRRLFVQKIDRTGSATDLKQLSEIPTDKESDGSFQIRWQEGSTGFLVAAIPQFFINEEARVHLTTFDAALNQQTEMTFELPYSHEFVDFVDFQMTPDGTVIAVSNLLRTYAEEQSRSKVPQGSECLLHRLYPDGRPAVTDTLNTGSKLVHNAWFRITGGKTYLGGFYSTDEEGPIDGSFLAEINTRDMSTRFLNYDPLPKSLMNVFEEWQYDWYRKHRVQHQFELVEVLEHGQGGKTLMIQQRNEVSGQKVLTQSSGARNFYDYSHILTVRLDDSGNTLWTTHIPTSQYFEGDARNMGFLSWVADDDVYVIYNDNSDNETTWKEGKGRVTPLEMWGLRHAVIARVRTDNRGIAEYEAMGSTIDNDNRVFHSNLSVWKPGNPGVYYVVASAGNKVRTGRVRLTQSGVDDDSE